MADEVTMLIFDLGGIRFGTDISHVLGMERMMGREPHDYDSEGRIIFPKYGPTRILDITDKLGKRLNLSVGIGSMRVLIMKEKKANAGLVVDKVRGVRKIPLSRVHPLPSLLRGATAPAIFGIAQDGDDLLFLVDLMNFAQTMEDKDEKSEQP